MKESGESVPVWFGIGIECVFTAPWMGLQGNVNDEDDDDNDDADDRSFFGSSFVASVSVLLPFSR